MKTKKSTNPLNEFPEIKKSEINFFTEQIKFVLKNKKKRKFWINSVFKAEAKSNYAVNIILCDDDFLFSLNTKYLKHKTYTDVITFDYSTTFNIIGEIYISIERIKENAKIFQNLTELELSRVIVHGILHLCGYKDKSKAEKKLMTQKEDYYLSLL